MDLLNNEITNAASKNNEGVKGAQRALIREDAHQIYPKALCHLSRRSFLIALERILLSFNYSSDML